MYLQTCIHKLYTLIDQHTNIHTQDIAYLLNAMYQCIVLKQTYSEQYIIHPIVLCSCDHIVGVRILGV